MEPRGHIRRVFAGANSARGFWSLYEEQMRLATEQVYVIKGGPGNGKSTFIRRIAEDLAANGFDVDLLMCSSDTASVDGFYAPALGVAVIDGTAPHVVDPVYPGVVGEVVDFGRFMDRRALRARREAILATADANRACYDHVYHYLAAARVFYDDVRRHIDRCGARDVPTLDALAADLIREVLGEVEPRSKPGRNRPLFASAITPDGFRNHMDTIFHPLRRRFVIRGQWGTGKSTIVGRLRDEAIRMGYDVESYYCGLDPLRLEHLVIPELEVGVITSELPHTFEPRSDDVVLDTAQAVDARSLERALEDLNASREMYGRSMELAIHWLARAKALHDDLERYYAPHVNFTAIDELRGELLARIYGGAHELGLLSGTGP
ncbi:MAG TPA: hypothetical protein VF282_09755 [Bacillota bacterium]